MFGFGKRKAGPVPCKANPGICVEGKVALTNGNKTRTEAFNVVSLAASVLRERGHSVTKETAWLEHSASGFQILPQLVALQPLEDGGVQTVTTVQTNHPKLSPEGVFEYQHSTGTTVADSISKGLDQWAQTDFVALLEALQSQPESCMAMVLEFPAADGKPARVRRAILGPVAHLMTEPPAKKETTDSEEHPFCPCCLLTRSFEAFKGLVESDGFYCLRLFALRDVEGAPQADCRVNGEDWEQGAEALRAYASTWPPAGYEFRKQYVVLQTIEQAPA